MQKLDPNSALKSIFADEQWLVKTGIGGMAYAASLLLLMLNFFMLPLSIILVACSQGYLLRCMRTEYANSGPLLPGWGNPLDLFMSGLTGIAIQSLLIAVAVFITVMLGSIFTVHILPQINAHYSVQYLAMGIALIILIALLWIGTWFVLNYLMVNLAIEETSAAGFALNSVLKKASQDPLEFIAAWITGEGLKQIAIWLPVVTVFGAFLLPSTLFIAQIAAAKMAAQVWAEKGKNHEIAQQ